MALAHAPPVRARAPPTLARSARALSRTLSTIDAAAPAAPPPVLVDAGFAAVVGACYVGATLWAYNDGVFGKMFGGEAKAAEQAQVRAGPGRGPRARARARARTRVASAHAARARGARRAKALGAAPPARRAHQGAPRLSGVHRLTRRPAPADRLRSICASPSLVRVLAQAKDQLTAMEEDLAAIKKAVEEGATKKKRRP